MSGMKWFVLIVVLLLIAVALTAIITQGFSNYNPYGWFDKTEDEATANGNNNTTPGNNRNGTILIDNDADTSGTNTNGQAQQSSGTDTNTQQGQSSQTEGGSTQQGTTPPNQNPVISTNIVSTSMKMSVKIEL